jgi:DNA-binding LytR/AlgR family response regulator
MVSHMNKNLSVIIAEDKTFDRKKLELFANQLGLKVVSSVGSGEWLIDDFNKFVPELVFLDIDLAGIDGLTAYKKILEQGHSPYLIMVSGSQDSKLILKGFQMNCIDFVSKPVTIERLTEAVNKARVIIEKDLLLANPAPVKIIQIKSHYRTYLINENKLIYAHKIKGGHKTIVYVEGEQESGVETTHSITDIQEQCSNIIFSPNQSNLINVNYIKNVYASENFFGTYIIKLQYKDIEVELPRRKRKEFELLYSQAASQ